VIFLYLLPTLISSFLSNDEEKENPRFWPGAFDRDIFDLIQPVVLGLERVGRLRIGVLGQAKAFPAVVELKETKSTNS